MILSTSIQIARYASRMLAFAYEPHAEALHEINLYTHSLEKAVLRFRRKQHVYFMLFANILSIPSVITVLESFETITRNI